MARLLLLLVQSALFSTKNVMYFRATHAPVLYIYIFLLWLAPTIIEMQDIVARLLCPWWKVLSSVARTSYIWLPSGSVA